MRTHNILLSGVGGQGTITAAKLLTTGLMNAGYDVKMSEIHGMSQRGGTVLSQVRYGDEVQSPVIEPGTADLLVAFEEMEAMRYLNYLKKDGTCVVNETQIWPMPVVIGSVKYPQGILDEVEKKVALKKVPASELAEQIGNPKTMNVILLGAIVQSMNLEHIDWEKIIRENIKPQFHDINIEAFKRGLELSK